MVQNAQNGALDAWEWKKVVLLLEVIFYQTCQHDINTLTLQYSSLTSKYELREFLLNYFYLLMTAC